MHPAERLLNLITLLLEARRPLTFEQIRGSIPAYGEDGDEASRRMFERDKDALRDLGIPLETRPTDAWEVELGYLIPKDLYYLPDIEFTPEELSALFLTAHAAAGEEAQGAFLKLFATRGERVLSALSGGPVTGGVDPAGPSLKAVSSALASRLAVRFAYRSGSAAAASRPRTRVVDPFGLVYRGGAWYLVGHDRGRDAVRAFKLSRVVGEVSEAGEAAAPPEGFRASEHVRVGTWGPGEPELTATVAFSPKVAWWAVAAPEAGMKSRVRADGWVEAEVPAVRGDAFLSWVLQFGEDAEILAPPDLRAAAAARLRALASEPEH